NHVDAQADAREHREAGARDLSRGSLQPASCMFVRPVPSSLWPRLQRIGGRSVSLFVSIGIVLGCGGDTGESAATHAAGGGSVTASGAQTGTGVTGTAVGVGGGVGVGGSGAGASAGGAGGSGGDDNGGGGNDSGLNPSTRGVTMANATCAYAEKCDKLSFMVG